MTTTMNASAIFKKLRLDDDQNLLIVNAPNAYETLLKNLRYDAKPQKRKQGQYDFVQVFATTQAELEKMVIEFAPYGKYDCLFWACYPKGTGKIKSDIKRETVWRALALAGLETVTQVAIDETWSALRARPHEQVGK
jgi:hypothetical protein